MTFSACLQTHVFFYAESRMQIHTVAVGAAIGHACLLLSAGSKGKRFMMPHAKGVPTLLCLI